MTTCGTIAVPALSAVATGAISVATSVLATTAVNAAVIGTLAMSTAAATAALGAFFARAFGLDGFVALSDVLVDFLGAAGALRDFLGDVLTTSGIASDDGSDAVTIVAPASSVSDTNCVSAVDN
jgi:hypothetical protein